MARPNSVGARVITDMHFRRVEPTKEVQVYAPNCPDAIVVDLDGTLALHNGRSPYDFEAVLSDSLNVPLEKVITRLAHSHLVIICTGRPDSCRLDTIAWLSKFGIRYGALHMRKTDDVKPDHVVKLEIFQNYIEPFYNVTAVFDDRNQVVDMWRRQGLLVCQVNQGDF